MRYTTAIFASFLLVVIAACSGGGSSRETFTARDSAGIHVVENVSPVWGDGDVWRLGDQPLVDIGGLEGDPDYELFRVSNSVRLSDGRIVIGNNGTNEIRFYDESGVHLLDAGGEGEGPGEFSFVAWVSRYRGDSIAAYDMRQLRISIFDSSGQFARSFPMRGQDGSGRGRARGVFENGAVFLTAVALSEPADGNDVTRQEESLYAVSQDGERHDSLSASLGNERFIYNPGSTSGGRTMVFVSTPMFGRLTEYGIHGNQLYVASNDTYEVRVHGHDGSLASIVRRQHDLLEVTDADIEALRDQQLGGDTPPQMRQTMIDVLEATPIRETMPAYERIVLDQVGNLWVEEYRRPNDTVRRWTVFNTGGVMLGTLPTPDRFVIHDVGRDFVLGKWTDELDIEHVQMYELIKP